MNIRFLTANEYAATASLFTECFGFDGEFMEEFYGSINDNGSVSGVIKDGIIAAAEDDTGFVAIVQVIYKTAIPVRQGIKEMNADRDGTFVTVEDKTDNNAAGSAAGCADNRNKADNDMSLRCHADETGCKVPYIMGVCTLPAYRHRGLMDRLMTLVIDRLRAEGYPWCFLIAVNKDIYRHLGFTYDWKLTERECELLYADDGLDTASGRLLNADHIENVTIV